MNLQDTLVGQWGKENVAVYDLAPLRRADVVTAAVANGIDADAFLEEVERLNVIPFAMRPITLDALLTQYKDSGTIGTTRIAIYHDYCRRLCQGDESRIRIAAGFVGQYEEDERMAVAARIAAVTIFTNHTGIWSDPLGHPLPEGCVAVQDLFGDVEPVGSNRDVDVGRRVVQEALSTELLKSPQRGRIPTWTHPDNRGVSCCPLSCGTRSGEVDQIRGLLFHPGDPQHKLVPHMCIRPGHRGSRR